MERVYQRGASVYRLREVFVATEDARRFHPVLDPEARARYLASDGGGRDWMMRALRDAFPEWSGCRDPVEVVLKMLRIGRLTLEERRRETHRFQHLHREEVEPEPVEERTWIEVELVDHRGAPVPHEVFVLRFEDGTRRSAMLDGNGFARVTGLVPGTWEIEFPDRAPGEWSAA